MDVHVSIGAQTLFHLGPIPVTNSMLVMFIVMAALLIVGTWLARKIQNETVPGRAAGTAEMIVEYLVNLCEATAGKRIGRKILPLIGGLFIFIIISNFTGLLPGVGTIYVEETGVHETAGEATLESDGQAEAAAAVDAASEDAEEPEMVPILRPPSADLNMTLAMSIVTFVTVQIAGVAAHGAGGRIKHMANPPFLFPIEVISELSRIISLAARLFGNVFAGEILLGVMYAMGAAIKVAIIPFLFPVVFLGLEVLFGTIQALVFALLSLIYVYLAAAGHDEHDEHATEASAHNAGASPALSGD